VPSRKRRIPLRVKIIAWSFIPAAIILTAVALVTYYAYQRVTEDLVIERDRELARLTAGELANSLQDYSDLLSAVAREFRIMHAAADAAASQEALAQARRRLVLFDGGVFVLNHLGRVMAAEPERPETIGQDWSTRPYFRRLLGATGEPAFSSILADGPGGAEVIAVAVSIVNDRGEFLGAMVGMFRLGASAISPFYGAILRLRLEPSGNAYVVDDGGRAIYASDPDRIGSNFSTLLPLDDPSSGSSDALSGQVGAIRTRALDGRDILASFGPVPNTSWSLVIEESWETLTQPSLVYGQFLLALLALGVVIPTVVVAIGVRRITGPIAELVEASRQIAEGDFGQTVSPNTGDELEDLADQFNRMSAELKASYAQLERDLAELRRIENELRKSEELYRTLARNFPNGAVLLFDGDLRYVLADGAGLAEVGLSKAMLEGKTIWELFTAEVVEILEPRYRAALAGEASALEVPFAGRIYALHALPIRNAHGDIVAGMAMTQDITLRQQAEAQLREREAQYRSIFESTTDGLFINTLDGQLVDFNPAAAHMHGYTPDEFRQLQPSQFIHPGSFHVFAEYIETVKAGQPFRGQAVDIRKDGTAFHVEVLGSGFTYRGQPHTLAVVRDITERVQAHELLEQRVAERTRELQRRAEQFRVINEVGQRITSILTVDDLLAQTVRLIQETFNYYFTSVGLIDATAGEVVVKYGDPLRLRVGKDGIIGWVAGAGEPLLVPDVRQDSRYIPSPSASQARSELAVPIKSRGQSIGVLDVESDRVDAFDESDVAVVQSLANQLGVAIENARLYESEQRRAEQFRVLAEVGRRITSILDVDQLLSQTVQLMSQAFGYYHVGIAMIEGDMAIYRTGAGTLWKEHMARFQPLKLKVGQEGITGWVAGSGEPLLVPDVSQDSRYVWMEGSQTRSELALPILAKDRTIGVLDVQSDRANAFDQSDRVVLQSLASQLAVAIENARLYEQAQQLAALEERQKLARELHDSVSQALYGIALGAKTARTLLDHDPGRVAEPLDYVLSLAEAGLAEMRALIFELRPESLEMEGVVAALTKQTASLQARHHIEVETAFGDEPRLPLPTKEALYRIAQEALNNIVKHARASRVNVRLETGDGSVRLEIGDNGIGFDPHGEFAGHLGLRSMRERAEKAGGTFTVESAPDQGTRILVWIPLDRDSERVA